MTNSYDDIIQLPRPAGAGRPKMPIRDRAAQFSPFAALAGYDGAVKEAARMTCGRIEPSEDWKAVLNQKLLLLARLPQSCAQAAITYFLPDSQKDGGAYVTAVVSIEKIDTLHRALVLTDGSAIPLENIFELDSELLQAFF